LPTRTIDTTDLFNSVKPFFVAKVDAPKMF
jgi:hypothetical protein